MSPELLKEIQTLKFTRLIKEELMEIAWNPDRLRWVFDIHETRKYLSPPSLVTNEVMMKKK